jgi:low temperature requirement protein LtrA
MPDEAVGGRSDEHEVTPVELFFDLVFVFAITQVTRLFVQEPTWLGLLRGMLVLAAVWWAWNAFAWLTSAENIDEGGVRLAILGTTALMLGVALAVPRAFARDAILFAVAYFLVRAMHVVLSLIVRREDSESREALLRFIPTALIGASILVIAAFVGGDLRIALWIIALLIDYSGPAVIGMGQGWAVAPEHFAERYGLIILIALGESVVAIGVAANFVLNAKELLAAALGMITVSALWWLYFDVGALFVRRSFRATRGADRARLALDAYSYLHLPLVGGIVLFAFGLETTLSRPGEHLQTVPAVALCGGAALYLLAHVAVLRRSTRRLFRRRTWGTVALVVLIPAALYAPAVAALALVTAVCAGVAGVEALNWREDRLRVRHPERAEEEPLLRR